MSVTKHANISVVEIARLSAINGGIIDISKALEFAELLKHSLKKMSTESYLAEALSTACIVWYYRPFAKGRHNLNGKIAHDLLAKLSEKHQNIHNKFKLWRDKHIAHPVNEYEDTQIVTYYNDDEIRGDGIRSFSIQNSRVMWMEYEDIEDFQCLANALLDLLHKELSRENDIVLKIIRSMPARKLLGNQK